MFPLPASLSLLVILEPHNSVEHTIFVECQQYFTSSDILQAYCRCLLIHSFNYHQNFSAKFKSFFNHFDHDILCNSDVQQLIVYQHHNYNLFNYFNNVLWNPVQQLL